MAEHGRLAVGARGERGGGPVPSQTAAESVAAAPTVVGATERSLLKSRRQVPPVSPRRGQLQKLGFCPRHRGVLWGGGLEPAHRILPRDPNLGNAARLRGASGPPRPPAPQNGALA